MGYDWSKVVNEGAEAGLDGLPIDCCPYAEGSSERELWLGGWHCAMDGVDDVAIDTNEKEAPRIAAE